MALTKEERWERKDNHTLEHTIDREYKYNTQAHTYTPQQWAGGAYRCKGLADQG